MCLSNVLCKSLALQVRIVRVEVTSKFTLKFLKWKMQGILHEIQKFEIMLFTTCSARYCCRVVSWSHIRWALSSTVSRRALWLSKCISLSSESDSHVKLPNSQLCSQNWKFDIKNCNVDYQSNNHSQWLNNVSMSTSNASVDLTVRLFITNNGYTLASQSCE